MKRSFALSSLLMFSASSALAQDALKNIVRSSTTSKTIFAAFDVRPAAANPATKAAATPELATLLATFP